VVDPVTKSLLSDFLSSQQIATPSEPEQFEHFVNYVVMFDLFPEEFDVEDIATGAGEFGLDGLAVIVNDTIIVDEEQLEDLADNSSSLTVQFVFTQAKSAKSFNAGELSQFLLAVNDFFGERMAFVQGEKVQTLHRIKNKLYGYAPKFVRGLPRLSLHYATTGTWQSDPNLIAVRDAHLITLREKHMFSQVDFLPIDAARLQKLYFQTKNALKISVNFQSNIALPMIQGVRESYIGVLSVVQYLMIVRDEHGTIRRRLFFDNIRDYQGDTDVNRSIAETIASERRIEFPLRNNGITIVSRKLQRVGNDFQLEDFQIVNGCQTSHVIANSWKESYGDMLIPVKIIVTEDEEITRSIIVASNSQNDVDRDSFWALDPIHKKIEIFFEGKAGDASLFYERRPGQYNAVSNIEKVRVVTKDGLLKNFASVFLEEPNQVGRYYKDLIPRIGKDIFSAQHEVFPYYTAAFFAFRLEWLFRNRRLDSKYKPFRFQLCMAARLILERERKLDARKKLFKGNCEVMDAVLMDVDASQALFENAIAAVDETIAALGSQVGLDRRTAKMRDMRDSLRARLATQSAPHGQPVATT
jgi:hypothetical protein